VAPNLSIDETKSAIDLDTVKAIIRSRLHLMEHYAKRVILPVHKSEVAQAEKILGRKLKIARRALICFDGLMDEVQRRRLQIALNSSETLKIVYEFRHSLQAIWARAGTSQEKLRQELQDWCHSAESSGIQALREFSIHLRGYSLSLPQ
jgi:stearoyl-CoA desaturase (delta-9 desaturase)